MGVLTETELETLTAMVDCLIPADVLGPSASQAGVVDFICNQLAGPYGAGARTHVAAAGSGPPLARYRAGLAALDRRAAAAALCRFVELAPPERIRLLTLTERDVDDRDGGALFFDLVLANTMEGFLADPIHGGNRAETSWRMIGFPGCGHDYTAQIGRNAAVSELVPVRSIATLGGLADA